MRTLGANITALKDTKAGAAPTWILKLTVGGVDYYLSDNEYTITPWAVDTLPWITSWGELRQGVSGAVGEYQIADFVVSCLVDPDATTNIETLIENDIEESRCALYVWFHGSTDAPVPMFTGYVREVVQQSETSVSMMIQDESITFERVYVGETADETKYPDIDPDDAGNLEPIIYGSVDRVPALAVVSGALTSLVNDITSTQTSFAVSSGDMLAAGDKVQIENETIFINSISGKTITSATRGYNTTTPQAHQRGAMVIEIKANFIYLLAQHPLDSIDEIYARVGQSELDVTSIVTPYTGKAGDELAGYEGKAVIALNSVITVDQVVQLALDNNISLIDQTDVLDQLEVYNGTITVRDAIEGLNFEPVTKEVTHNHTTDLTNTKSQYGNALPETDSTTSLTVPLTFTPSFPTVSGTIYEGSYRYKIIMEATGGTFTPILEVSTDGGTTWIEVARATSGIEHEWFGTVNGSTAPMVRVRKESAATGTLSYELTFAERTIVYSGSIYDTNLDVTNPIKRNDEGQDISGTISRSTGPEGKVIKDGEIIFDNTIDIIGNSTANTLIADSVFFSGSRNFASPVDALNALLNTDITVPSNRAVTVEQVGTLPASYAINGAITEKRTALEWANRFAFQLRSYLRFFDGKAQLMVRPDTYTSDKTLDACQIDTTGRKVWGREKTAQDDIINVVELKYNRDWSDVTEEPFRSVTKASNSASISVFGECERPRLFEFEFVTSAAMADDLRDFYLARQATRSWRHTFSTFLNNLELDFNDAVTLGFRNNEVAAIKETRFAPGDYRKIDTITFVAED